MASVFGVPLVFQKNRGTRYARQSTLPVYFFGISHAKLCSRQTFGFIGQPAIRLNCTRKMISLSLMDSRLNRWDLTHICLKIEIRTLQTGWFPFAFPKQPTKCTLQKTSMKGTVRIPGLGLRVVDKTVSVANGEMRFG